MFYDYLYIVQPNVTDEDFDSLLSDVQAKITSKGGKILKSAIWGKKQLAYPIKKYRQGIYVNLFYEASPDTPKFVEDFVSLKDDCFRQMTVKMLKKDVARFNPQPKETQAESTDSKGL